MNSLNGHVNGHATILNMQANTDPPLYVDLDGTLVQTDTLVESLKILMRKKPHLIFCLPFWVMQGRARFKAYVARRVTPPPESLPYHRELIDFLREQKRSGRKIFLATAANRRIAQRVANYLGFFDGIIATSDEVNYKGSAKLEAIRAHAPHGQFDYMGDSMADLPIFKGARHAYLVNPSYRLLQLAQNVSHIERIFDALPMRRQSA